jgi:hypothetical protein
MVFTYVDQDNFKDWDEVHKRMTSSESERLSFLAERVVAFRARGHTSTGNANRNHLNRPPVIDFPKSNKHFQEIPYQEMYIMAYIPQEIV